MSEIDLLIQELRDTIDNQRKEIQRLNNIITKLEKWLNKYFVGTMSDAVLNKLKELKENK